MYTDCSCLLSANSTTAFDGKCLQCQYFYLFLVLLGVILFVTFMALVPITIVTVRYISCILHTHTHARTHTHMHTHTHTHTRTQTHTHTHAPTHTHAHRDMNTCKFVLTWYRTLQQDSVAPMQLGYLRQDTITLMLSDSVCTLLH